MSEAHCFSPCCSNAPIIYCDCADSFTFICEEHAIPHCESEGLHHYSKIFTKINEESRNSAIETVYYLEAELEKIRSTILQESSSLITHIQQVTENALNNLKMCDEQLKEIISQISQMNEINNSKPLGFAESLLKIKPEEMCKVREKKLPKLYLNKISQNAVERLFRLDSLEKICQGFTQKRSGVYKDSLPMKTNTIKFVWSCSGKKISYFDAESQNAYQVDITNVDQNLDQYGSKCLLPDGSLFYYGNGAHFIITASNEIKEITMLSECLNGCSVYFDGFVYALAGSPPCSQKYNLSTSEWTNLATFPINGIYSSCALYEDFIFVGGRDSTKAVYYDIINNSYSEIPLTLGTMTSKTFLVRKESIFLLEFSKQIYECKGDFNSWVSIGTCENVDGNAPVIGYSVHHKKKIYFVNYYGIYAFDLIKKNVEQVKTLPDSSSTNWT
ncbi:unnamed protein product [Blepharisma stoltei]|uniref:Uncharacterized protein n=1 Tax=Blepharisma stoltei TaxID=1481888 RepID=A0AAU9JCI6_9CILI|nr:unnamed protein product [Blepharisma stoltei]